jgi:replicative DNA helicase
MPTERNARYQPIDADAERAVLAAVLTSPASFDEVTGMIGPDDFGIAAHQVVWQAVLALDASGRPVDVVTVVDELRRARQLQRAGGSEGVESLLGALGDAANVTAHAEIVASKARLRRVIDAGRVMSTEAAAPDADALAVTAHAEELVFGLAQERDRGSVVTMSEAVPRMLAEIAKGRTKMLMGHSTGLPELDRLTGGFQPGQLIIVAARPGMGKSSLALQMARHIAETSGTAVPFLSYEMSTDELVVRMLANAMNYDMTRLRQGLLPDGADRELAAHAERIANVQMLVDDNPPATIGGVRSQLRRMARRSQIGAVVVDYLQLMDADRRRDANRAEEVSEVTRGLKRLASELQVPVIALSQLNRQLEQRPNKRPQLSDLRDSGSIEQDANLVLFIYREAVYNSGADPEACEVIIGKQRSGPAGLSIPCTFKGSSTRFDPAGQAFSTPTGGGSGMRDSRSPF